MSALLRLPSRPLALLLTVLVLVLGCGGGGGGGGGEGGGWTYSSLAEVKRFRGATDVRRLPHAVPAGEDELVLRLDLEVEAGAVTASLTDPAGAERWRRRLEAPAEELLEESLPAAAGEWVVTLEMDGASGSYDLRLVSR